LQQGEPVPKVNRRRTAVVPSVEPLDPRTLLSATLWPHSFGGESFRLELTGSAGSDAIVVKSVSGNPGAVEVYGVEGVTDGAVFTDLYHVQVLAGSGDDHVVVDVQGPSAWVYGHAGDDVLVSHGGDVGFSGGNGDDTMVGSAATSDFSPGPGEDVIKLRGGGAFIRYQDRSGHGGGLDRVFQNGRRLAPADFHGGPMGTVSTGPGISHDRPSDEDVVADFFGRLGNDPESPNAILTHESLFYELELIGSDGDDRIIVKRLKQPGRARQEYDDVAVYGVPGVADGTVFKKIHRLIVRGGGGDDLIRVGVVGSFTNVYGDGGDDTLVYTRRFSGSTIRFNPGQGDDAADTGGFVGLIVSTDTVGPDTDGEDRLLSRGRPVGVDEVRTSKKVPNRLIVTRQKLSDAHVEIKLMAQKGKW
jgi:hypothetical protein